MVALQVPRLTTTLRAFHSGGINSGTLDTDKAYIERKKILETIRLTRSAVTSVGSSDLAKKLLISWDLAPITIRHAYEQFLKIVEELIGGEVQSEELYSAASIVYDVLHDLDTSCSGRALQEAVSKKAEQLVAIFGAVTKINIASASEIARKLHDWRASIGGDSLSIAAHSDEAAEFGAEISFQLPTSRDLDAGAVTMSCLGARNERAYNFDNGFHAQKLEVDHTEVDLKWLRNACKKVSLEGSSFSSDELAITICNLLESNNSGDEIAGSLFDLMGDQEFELIQVILQHRKEFVELLHKGLSFLKSKKLGQNSQNRMPSYGVQVSIQTGSDRQVERLRRKEEKKHSRSNNAVGESGLEWLAENGGFSALVDCIETMNGGLDSLIGTGDANLSGTAIPQGSTRKNFKGYEEVHVPAAPTASLKPHERLVKISEIDEFAQVAFDGYKTLNRIQSRIFPTAYTSNENILVCAPTGAGKTNIAMITVLREIQQHMKYGILQKNEFKIVYVAPMKALAAEVTAAFSRRLAPLNAVVKELTGDMQLTKRELEETQMIVTTPEKWDVITRKTSDMALATLVKLLIIDEVHLLNDDRGPVIESLVARTLRQVESSQSMIRIVGLSATLPNYLEVARFLRVNPDTGLFHFDASYRPVPLTQQYIGITESNFVVRNNLMNEICYKKVLEAVNHGHQAMVFVHSRKDTVKTARVLVEFAQRNDELERFENVEHPLYTSSKKEILKSRNKEIGELFLSGFGVHHAGMLRSDRALTEKLFSEGLIKVLVCTATLAWGVNLPAHTVIIKGTQLYDPKAGGWRELSMLDVMQIFGRAGRPQFDTSGEGIIITAHNKLAHYLRLLTHQSPIESQFIHSLKDNLNAEIVLGTVTNVREASIWLGYTYLFVRMSSNPLVYGMSWEELLRDTDLLGKRHALITDAARALDRAKMLRFDEKSGNFYVTDLGRVASHYYLQYTSVETYNEMLKQHMSDSELFKLISHSSEFENIIVREEEQQELSNLLHDVCPLEISSSPEDKYTKINILIQVYISRGHVEGFSLVADSAYISASLGRIMRSLFEICLRRGWCSMTALLLEYCKAVDHRIWPHQHPLRQFEAILSHEILHKLEDRCASMDRLYDMDEKEIGALIRNPYGGKVVAQCMENFPSLLLAANISPITRTVLQVALTITPNFTWKERFHVASLRWWIWVEDSENEHIYHSDLVIMTKKMVAEGGQTITFAIPIFEPLPSQYYVRAVSDSWLQASTLHVLSFQHLILPEMHPPHTELLNLRPLPISALRNKIYEDRYKFSFFNPIQTQTFHILYHTDHNVLLGAPTGSGKTISAELAMLHLFNNERDMKVVYIAPLKALVRERVDDWKRNLVPILGKKLVELTGDFTPDLLALLEADVIISTPEKWDGISRNWHNRDYVKKVGLMIFDEIHLLGGDRGPVLEVIVSRMRYISSQTECPIRFVGLSTALANARDLANWLGVEDVGLFNFKPSVRPVPLEVHIQGFPGKFYCPRMNSMNKPTYAAIRTHSPVKPVLIFVSSRRQTRLTALDLIQFAAADEQPKQFLNMSDEEIDVLISQLGDDNLKHTLQFGIGIHHAGLNDKDRTLVEELFVNTKIQVLVCTSTLAWGVNFPAHLVVIKGTEYYDGKTKRYVDYPITDVLQMMGRAGRPQYDQYGKAVILVHEPKKSFYKKFLYEPFPVESSLMNQIHDHVNAEVSAGTITSKQDAVDYLTWTYLFRRLVVNPSYYGLERTDSGVINSFLSNLVTMALQELEVAGCIRVNEDHTVDSLMLGFVASQYYLHYMTVALFSKKIGADSTLEELLYVLSSAAEYNELPVRHNEDKLNELLARDVRVPVDLRAIDDPHVKTNLLLQAHFSRIEHPVSDYITDTKSVLDQSIRIVQAMVDVAANGGWLKTAMHSMYLLQMVMQGTWWNDSHLWMLPHVNSDIINVLASSGISSIGQLLACSVEDLRRLLHKNLLQSQLSELIEFLRRLPRVEINYNTTLNGSTQIVEIQLRRINKTYRGRALLPRFPKTKQEGWWLILGSRDTWELHGIKRVSFTNYLKTKLIVPTIRAPEKLSLYLVSDCYLGLDQEHILS